MTTLSYLWYLMVDILIHVLLKHDQTWYISETNVESSILDVTLSHWQWKDVELQGQPGRNYVFHVIPLPEPNMFNFKFNHWKIEFLRGWPIFRCSASLRESIWQFIGQGYTQNIPNIWRYKVFFHFARPRFQWKPHAIWLVWCYRRDGNLAINTGSPFLKSREKKRREHSGTASLS